MVSILEATSSASFRRQLMCKCISATRSSSCYRCTGVLESLSSREHCGEVSEHLTVLRSALSLESCQSLFRPSYCIWFQHHTSTHKDCDVESAMGWANKDTPNVQVGRGPGLLQLILCRATLSLASLEPGMQRVIMLHTW